MRKKSNILREINDYFIFIGLIVAIGYEWFITYGNMMHKAFYSIQNKINSMEKMVFDDATIQAIGVGMNIVLFLTFVVVPVVVAIYIERKK